MLTVKLLLVIFVLTESLLLEVIGFTFELTKTTNWQYPGRCLGFTLKATLSKDTPLSLKVRAPHINSSPHMVILNSTFEQETGCTSFTGSYKPNITARTSNKKLEDDLFIDMGNVTVNGKCIMYFSIKFMLIAHANFTNGQVVWPGFAFKYLNDDVFAIQHAVKTMAYSAPHPSLSLTLETPQAVFDASKTMVVNVKVEHDCSRTSAKAVSSEVTLHVPPSFQFSSLTTNTGSVNVAKSSGSGLVFQAGEMDFYERMDFSVAFTFSSSNNDYGLLKAAIHGDVTAQGSSSCPSNHHDYPSGDSVTVGSWVYRPFTSCDSAPGSGVNDIVYRSFNASSYSIEGLPEQAKDDSPGAWKPSNSLKNDLRQYLQVSFTTLVKLRRFTVKGQCDTYDNDTDRFVKSVKVYYSTNGAIWRPVKEGNNQIFKTNSNNCNQETTVILPYVVEAKQVRINPVDFENAIAMKVNFYGCKSTTAVKEPPMEIPNRSILAYLNNIIVCNTGMNRRVGESSCHLSSDGQSWEAMHFLVQFVAFYDPVDGFLYGLGGQDGTVAFQSPPNPNQQWSIVTMNEFTTKRASSTSILAKSADNVVITDDMKSLTPASGDLFNANRAGITWAFSGQGVHSSTDGGSRWDLKVTWSCKELKI